MNPRVNQFPRWNLHKGRPDGKYRKVQVHNLSSGGNLHRDAIGGIQSEEHRRGEHLTVGYLAVHSMSGLWGQFDMWFHDSPLQNIE